MYDFYRGAQGHRGRWVNDKWKLQKDIGKGHNPRRELAGLSVGSDISKWREFRAQFHDRAVQIHVKWKLLIRDDTAFYDSEVADDDIRGVGFLANGRSEHMTFADADGAVFMLDFFEEERLPVAASMGALAKGIVSIEV